MPQGIIISLIVLGVFLLALEVFVIPGFGVSGILGMAALITGIFLVTDSLARRGALHGRCADCFGHHHLLKFSFTSDTAIMAEVHFKYTSNVKGRICCTQSFI